MRFKEFKPINEGGASGGTRYNSELGMLAGFCGIDVSNFDPKNPELSFTNTEVLANPESVFDGIKKFLPDVYDPKKFAAWHKVGINYKNQIDAELSRLGLPASEVFDWQGGSNINEEGAADIVFANNDQVQGVSIKDKSGITLANLTPKVLGLGASDDEEGDADVFQFSAKNEYTQMKKYVFQRVLDLAMKTPGKAVVPIKSKYRIIYEGGDAPATGAVAPAAVTPTAVDTNPKLTPGMTNKKLPVGAEKIPMGQEPQTPINEQESVGIFTCIWDDNKEFKGTYEQILAASVKNAEWQRVFGDWLQKNWSSDKTLNDHGRTLFNKIAETFVVKIKNALSSTENLRKVLRMGAKAYFYATPKSIYFVPSINQVNNLAVQDVVYTQPKGTAQYFKTTIGYDGGTAPTEIFIYIRYANGIFARNPTVRVQKLVNPEGISWTKLT